MNCFLTFSDSLILVYRNATDFCILILYPASLPNSSINSNSFLVGSLGFSIYSKLSFANSDSFNSSFPIWMPFIYFSSLIALGETSNTMSNKSGKIRHPCLVPDRRGNAFNFSSLSMMLAVVLSYMAYIMLRYVLFIHTLLRDVEFCQMIFLHLLRWLYNFYPSFC